MPMLIHLSSLYWEGIKMNNVEKLNQAAREFFRALENMIGETETSVDIETMIEYIDERVQQIIEGE